ncbi:hypothetical protein [Arthrobacter sp. UYCu712]|uniref:hypothetical protein n=1 Tax=Arthrobacter sp. UYCu712 TaxID=3156340 RepID=UPI00339128FB
MATQETAVQIAFDVLQEVIATGADPRGPLGSGAAWTIDTYGTPAQRAQLQRLEMAASRKHGAEPSRTTAGAGKAKASDTQGMDALDRAIAKSFGTEEA